jgi:hypothetical protein
MTPGIGNLSTDSRAPVLREQVVTGPENRDAVGRRDADSFWLSAPQISSRKDGMCQIRIRCFAHSGEERRKPSRFVMSETMRLTIVWAVRRGIAEPPSDTESGVASVECAGLGNR